MRDKDVSKWFETLLSSALAKTSDKDRPAIIAAAYILKELCLDIKRLSEAVEVLAENSVPTPEPVQTGKATRDMGLARRWGIADKAYPERHPLTDDDVPFMMEWR